MARRLPWQLQHAAPATAWKRSLQQGGDVGGNGTPVGKVGVALLRAVESVGMGNASSSSSSSAMSSSATSLAEAVKQQRQASAPGTSVHYQLLIYRTKDEHLCKLTLTSSTPAVLQSQEDTRVCTFDTRPERMANDQQEAEHWSLQFGSQAEADKFCRMIYRARCALSVGSSSTAVGAVDVRLGTGRRLTLNDLATVRYRRWSAKDEDDGGVREPVTIECHIGGISGDRLQTLCGRAMIGASISGAVRYIADDGDGVGGGVGTVYEFDAVGAKSAVEWATSASQQQIRSIDGQSATDASPTVLPWIPETTLPAFSVGDRRSDLMLQQQRSSNSTHQPPALPATTSAPAPFSYVPQPAGTVFQVPPQQQLPPQQLVPAFQPHQQPTMYYSQQPAYGYALAPALALAYNPAMDATNSRLDTLAFRMEQLVGALQQQQQRISAPFQSLAPSAHSNDIGTSNDIVAQMQRIVADAELLRSRFAQTQTDLEASRSQLAFILTQNQTMHGRNESLEAKVNQLTDQLLAAETARNSDVAAVRAEAEKQFGDLQATLKLKDEMLSGAEQALSAARKELNDAQERNHMLTSDMNKLQEDNGQHVKQLRDQHDEAIKKLSTELGAAQQQADQLRTQIKDLELEQAKQVRDTVDAGCTTDAASEMVDKGVYANFATGHEFPVTLDNDASIKSDNESSDDYGDFDTASEHNLLANNEASALSDGESDDPGGEAVIANDLLIVHTNENVMENTEIKTTIVAIGEINEGDYLAPVEETSENLQRTATDSPEMSKLIRPESLDESTLTADAVDDTASETSQRLYSVTDAVNEPREVDAESSTQIDVDDVDDDTANEDLILVDDQSSPHTPSAADDMAVMQTNFAAGETQDASDDDVESSEEPVEAPPETSSASVDILGRSVEPVETPVETQSNNDESRLAAAETSGAAVAENGERDVHKEAPTKRIASLFGSDDETEDSLFSASSIGQSRRVSAAAAGVSSLRKNRLFDDDGSGDGSGDEIDTFFDRLKRKSKGNAGITNSTADDGNWLTKPAAEFAKESASSEHRSPAETNSNPLI